MTRISKWFRLVGEPQGFAVFIDHQVKIIRDKGGWIEITVDIESAVKQAIQNPKLPPECDFYNNEEVSFQLATVTVDNNELLTVLLQPKGVEPEPDWQAKVAYTDFIRLLNDRSA